MGTTSYTPPTSVDDRVPDSRIDGGLFEPRLEASFRSYAGSRRPQALGLMTPSRDRIPRRLGLYQDGPFRILGPADNSRLVPTPSDRAFLRFAIEVGTEFEEIVLFVRARRVGSLDDSDQALPPEVGFVELPYYESLLALGQVARALPGTARAFWRGLDRVDAVWVLGPHPLSFILVALALARRKRAVLGVRQDTVAYFRSRLGNRRAAGLLAARAWNLGFRALARRVATVVVGAELERQYKGPRTGLLQINVAQLRSADVVNTPSTRDWSGPIGLLTVGRIDKEKNPLLLVDAFARVSRAHPGRFSLSWVGTGPLEPDVRRRAADAGVLDAIDFVGFLEFGDALLARYRSAHIFVHVSLTEGVPATIIEALGSGTPVVATAVGGVPAALEYGRAGLLVPPSNTVALVAAIERLATDRVLWNHFAAYGPTLASGRTLDVNARRVARFIAGSVPEGSPNQPANEDTRPRGSQNGVADDPV